MKKLRLTEIRVGSRFRKDMGDIKELSESISENGLLQPIIVTGENVLIDGGRRLEALQLLGVMEADCVVIELVEEDGIYKLEFESNEMRKAFTISERVQMLEAFKNDTGVTRGAPKGNKNNNSEKSKGSHGSSLTSGDASSHKAKDSRKNDRAKAFDFGSKDTASRAKSVVTRGIPEIIELMDSEEVGVRTLVKIVKEDTDTQKRFVDIVKKYGKSKGYYYEYTDEIIEALEDKKINKSKADDLTYSIKVKPEKFTPNVVKKEIDDYVKYMGKAKSMADAEKAHKEAKEKKAKDRLVSIKIDKSNLSKSVREFITAMELTPEDKKNFIVIVHQQFYAIEK